MTFDVAKVMPKRCSGRSLKAKSLIDRAASTHVFSNVAAIAMNSGQTPEPRFGLNF